MWYENNILIGTCALTIISCFSLWLIPEQAKDVAIPAITGISGFVTGYVAKTIKDAVTTRSTTTQEETTNVPDKTTD